MITLTRHPENPILSPDPARPWEAEGVFNPGVVRIGEEVVMLYRAVGELEAYISRFGLAKSADGIHFTSASDEPVFGPHESFDQWATEDPRITKIEDDYYVTYVAVPERIMLNGSSFPRTVPLETATGLLKTRDFRTYENLGIISEEDSDNKDIVLFPRKINGRYAMLHRPNRWNRPKCARRLAEGNPVNWPCDLSALPENPAIWIAWSDDLVHWDNHSIFLPTSHTNDAKIGPGLPPIETPEGWLVIYHHVTTTDRPDGFCYSARAALFALEEPTRLIGKLNYDILAPDMPYEQERNSHIVFPTGGYVKDDTLYVYYGASDRYVCLATTNLTALIAELNQKTQ